MKNTTLFLPGFHLSTLRRKPRSCAQKLADERLRIRRHSISQLGECFGSFIPTHELSKAMCDGRVCGWIATCQARQPHAD